MITNLRVTFVSSSSVYTCLYLPVPDSVAQVAVMAGGPASLPCSLATEAEDSVRLVLWFRNADEKPIYTLDARGELTSSNRD